MKHLIFAVVVTSIALTGCKKTKTVAVQDEPRTLEIDESTQAMMKVIVNGEEMDIDALPIAEVIRNINIDGLGGEMEVEVMVSGDGSTCDLSALQFCGDAKADVCKDVQIEAIADMIFEDEHGNVYSMSTNGFSPEDMHGNAMGWVDAKDWHGKDMPHMHDKAIVMHKKMHMAGAHGKDMEVAWHSMGHPHKKGEWVGFKGDFHHGGDVECPYLQRECEEHERRAHEEDHWQEREHEEEFEFMHKVNLYNEVGHHLSESDAMAIFGVHMLRDNIDPELRLHMLHGIIEATFDREPGRNAALLVAIETLMEMGNEEHASWYMAELVISNSDHGHVPWEEDGYEHGHDEDDGHAHDHDDDHGHDDDEGHDHDHDDDWDVHDHPHPHGDHAHD